ncbi:MAG: SDR family NAD(P)-dependent oxidoreductase [Enterobacteriaceae bacterium]|nr:SDR family NAD(P)-dependent oxidoreductase [Enterobacteriaceae bacterium]
MRKNKEDTQTPFAHSSVSRFKVVKQWLPMPENQANIFSSSRRWLVVDESAVDKSTGDANEMIAENIAAALRQRGQQVTVLSLTPTLAGDESALDRRLTDIERQYGTIEGVICLQAPKQPVKTWAEVFSEQEYRAVETTFWLAKRLQGSLTGSGKGYFMVMMRGDGELLTSGRGCLPIVSAGVTGLTKSLNIEWKNVFCRTVDIEAGIHGDGFTDRDIANIVLEELQDSRTDVAEIGRNRQGERMTLALVEEPVLAASEPASAAAMPASSDNALPDDVFVVTGGARGITAQCVIALAKQRKAVFILLGRTDINAPLPAWSIGKTTPAERQAAAIAYLQRKGIPPTPVKVNQLLSRLIHTDEINATLQAIRQTGSRALYLHCDITVPAQVKAALEQGQQQFGQITGVIHGAGNLADKRIEKKTREDWHSVFTVKVKGLENLLRGLENLNLALESPGRNCASLRHIMLFSSVAGFFGNAGQTDYSMANEVLNKFAHLLFNQKPLPDKPNGRKNRPLIRAINWGPWDGGMVSDVLKRAYKAQNMVIIPLEEGTQRFVREFNDSRSCQITIGGRTYIAPKKQ